LTIHHDGVEDGARRQTVNRLSAALLAVALASGCTATKANVNLVLANEAVLRAKEANAPELAVYEWTLAVRYLQKAREEAGYADYKQSEELAKKAAEYADQAVIAIQKGGRGLDIDEAGDDLTDEPPPGAPPSNGGDLERLDELDE
jgi:hypothetical protein